MVQYGKLFKGGVIMRRKTTYHYTVYNANDNSVVFDIYAHGASKGDCQRILDTELINRHLYTDKLDSKIKIKGVRVCNYD